MPGSSATLGPRSAPSRRHNLLLATIAMAHLDPLSNVTSSFERESLVPDVVPSFAPSLLFSVIWPEGGEALLGNELPLTAVQDEPSIQFVPMNLPAELAASGGEGDTETTYTLAMLDPDAPSRVEPLYKSFRHWLVTRRRARRPLVGVLTYLR
jgi:phosphatidylethanolamine-binding protein